MPATSIRDLVVHNDDVVVGTHGRSFWILDDISPLRQLNAEAAAAPSVLFKPQVAYRVRRNVATDTPLPPEEPAGKNPPDGAIIYYHLKSKASAPVKLEIFDDKGRLVRRYASDDKQEAVVASELNVPTYWIRPPQVLSTEAGSHRFIWDMHFPRLAEGGGRGNYPISAIYMDTPSLPLGPAAHPGNYTVKLTVDGTTYAQPLTVNMDPRVPTPPEGLAQQFALSMQCYDGVLEARAATEQIRKLHTAILAVQAKAKGSLAEALTALDTKATTIQGTGGAGGRGRGMRGGRRGGGAAGPATLASVPGELSALMGRLQESDMTPQTTVVMAVEESGKKLKDLLDRWRELREKELSALNEQLKTAGLAEISVK
jgi:hypothetical protein